MKKYFVAILLLVSPLLVSAEPVDYSLITLAYYANLEDKTEFTDEQGRHFRVENIKPSKGLYLQEETNGKVKWKKYGVFYKFYQGKLNELITYSAGKKHGLRESYDRDGRVQFRDYYQAGKKHGLSQQFDEKGNRLDESNYADGVRHGKRYGYTKGKLTAESNYASGKLHGEVIKYNTKGKVSLKVYEKGRQIGKTLWLQR